MQTFTSSQKTRYAKLQHQPFGGAERDRTADPLLAKQVLSQLSYSPSQKVMPRSINCKHLLSEPIQLVGPGRLELPTSRLSGVRSNHLSYGPILVELKPIRSERSGVPSLSSGRKRNVSGDLALPSAQMRQWRISFDHPDWMILF